MKTTTLMLVLLTVGTSLVLAAPEAAALQREGGAGGGNCNGVIDDNCVCTNNALLCANGDTCTRFVTLACIDG